MAVGRRELPDFAPIEGIRLGVAEAGIKYVGRKDLVVIELDQGSSCAGVFTRNVFCAAPVSICKTNLERPIAHGTKAYLLINTGNANAGTGARGMEDALSCCHTLAGLTGIEASSVLPFSTGVIGEQLPVAKLAAGIPGALACLDEQNWAMAAQGILTTDTRPKGVSRQVVYAGEAITINGISKGAGMIKPNMATMLAFVGTDAKLSDTMTSELVQELAEGSFNRITIDGDTSTNDACMLFASGKSNAPELDTSHQDYATFKQALCEVFVELAQAIVRDGEGATKFVSVIVEQASTSQEALDVAYTIAHSPLIKTALFASDPNWGRILAALGRAPIVDLDLSAVEIYLGNVRIVHRGEKCPEYTESRGQSVMDAEEIDIRISLGRGAAKETVWTTDLSHEYVTINAEYRT